MLKIGKNVEKSKKILTETYPDGNLNLKLNFKLTFPFIKISRELSAGAKG